MRAGLPEPELNGDVHDEQGNFLACLDLLYRRYRVGIEYQSDLHAEHYAHDVERLSALRAAEWNIIEVTRSLHDRPRELVARVTRALRAGGWTGTVGSG